MNKYFKYPVNWVAISTYFSNSHLGLDFGWNSSKGGSKVAIYSSMDGKVVYAGNTGGSAGIMVKVRYDDKANNTTWYSQYKHLSKVTVKAGQTVKMGDQLGNMGGTGGFDPHLHFDLVKCPYNFNYNQESGNQRKTYSVDPRDYCVLYDSQSHGEDFKGVMSLLGTSKKVARDTKMAQIEVFGYKLRVRKSAGTNQAILGYCDYGIYNYTETKKVNGYTWYKLSFGWIAGTKEDTKVYPKEEDKVIEDIKNDDTLKDNKITELENKIKQLENELSKYSNLKTFISKKSGYYKIYLKENDKIYY